METAIWLTIILLTNGSSSSNNNNSNSNTTNNSITFTQSQVLIFIQYLSLLPRGAVFTTLEVQRGLLTVRCHTKGCPASVQVLSSGAQGKVACHLNPVEVCLQYTKLPSHRQDCFIPPTIVLLHRTLIKLKCSGSQPL